MTETHTRVLTQEKVTALGDDYAMDEREAADRIRELIDSHEVLRTAATSWHSYAVDRGHELIQALNENARLQHQYGEVVVEAASRLALRQEEIDRLTAEGERLTASLRDVRDRKNQRIDELLQHVARATEAEERVVFLMEELDSLRKQLDILRRMLGAEQA